MGRAGQDFCQVMLSTISSATCLDRCLLDLSGESRTPSQQTRAILMPQESSTAQLHPQPASRTGCPKPARGASPAGFSITFSHLIFFPCKMELKDKISDAFAAEAVLWPPALLLCHKPKKVPAGTCALPTSRQICRPRQLPLASCRKSPWRWAASSAHQVDWESPYPSPQAV